jgi:circadian clock protein KaiC
MDLKTSKTAMRPGGLPKCPTGIHGLDQITFGGLPRGRPTLLCGGAGCGKTLLGMEFQVCGATEFGKPGVCLSFEETLDELTANVASLGFDVAAPVAQEKLAIDHIVLAGRVLAGLDTVPYVGSVKSPEDGRGV